MSIVKLRRGDVTYCYESESYWDPELKQPRARRKLVGKLDPETGAIVPTSGKGGRKKGSKNKPKEKDPSVEALKEEAAEAAKYKGLYEKELDNLAIVKAENESLREELRQLKQVEKELRRKIARAAKMLADS